MLSSRQPFSVSPSDSTRELVPVTAKIAMRKSGPITTPVSRTSGGRRPARSNRARLLRPDSNEADEQGRATGGGGGGAKGGGQGEREPMPHVPDTVPGKRVTGAGARTEGREASRQTSEVGAVCRKAARTVLCGGAPSNGRPYRNRAMQPRLEAKIAGFGCVRRRL